MTAIYSVTGLPPIGLSKEKMRDHQCANDVNGELIVTGDYVFTGDMKDQPF